MLKNGFMVRFYQALSICIVLIFTSFGVYSNQSTTTTTTVEKPESSTPLKILVLGDSLSAAYGLTQGEGWVSLLQDMLQNTKDTQHISVVNGSISGETTDGGLSRLPRLLELHKPTHVLIELGGNDGLQGHNIKKLKNNLAQIVQVTQTSGAQALLQQMQIPTNYGRRYNTMFINAFAQTAEAFSIPLIPFFLEEIALQPELMQNDGIHPTAEAQPMIAEFMYENLVIPYLTKKPAS